MALTPKQKKFANEYLIDLNATRAYRAAYPAVKKDETAAQAGSRMLRNVKVSEYIEKRMKEREKRTEITQDRVLKEIAGIAFSKASDYARVIERQATVMRKDGTEIPLYDSKGKPILVQDVQLELTENLTEEQVRAIACIKNGKYGIEVVQCDKVRALELLGRHLGIFKDKVQLTGLETEQSKLEDIIKQMRGDG